MSLQLRVKIQKTNAVKAMKFAPNMSVLEVCKQIQEKIGDGGPDHGLFQPAGIKNPARWLRNDRTLQLYDLEQNDEVEYKKRHRPLKIKLMDGTVKTILIDDTLTVGDIVSVIGEKLSLPNNAEEFSLKADPKDGIEVKDSQGWLNSAQSLHEQGITEDAILLFQKKFYVNDATVSVDDPVNLHLVYVQSRDSTLAGNHPCTFEEAIQFAALQCQVQLGSYDPSKNRKLEVKEFLPPSFHKAKKAEEKIVKEHKKLVGMSEVNAKYRYVQLCRSLKTYGITFYHVKLRTKNQKKPTPVLLGITRDAVIFMDEETREVSKEVPITHLRRWAAAPTTFTLDFGDHEGEYVILETKEADAISSLLAGYIDILLKRKKDRSVVSQEDDDMIAMEEPSSAPIFSTAISGMTTSTIKGMGGASYGQSGYTNVGSTFARVPGAVSGLALPTNMGSAQSYVGTLLSEFGNPQSFSRNTTLTPMQWRKQLISNADAVMSSVGKLSAHLPPNMFDKSNMDAKAAEIATNLHQLISAARNAAFRANGDEDPDLLDAAKLVADAVKSLLAASKDLADHPNDPAAIERYNTAQRALQAATFLLQANSRGVVSDESSQQLLNSCARNVLASATDLVSLAKARNPSNNSVLSSADNTQHTAEELQTLATSLSPSIIEANSQSQLQGACKSVGDAIAALLNAAKASGNITGLDSAARDVANALAQLLAASKLAEPVSLIPDFTPIAKDMYDELTRLMGAQGNPLQIQQGQRAITAMTAKIAALVKDAAPQLDDENKEKLLNAIKLVADATKKLVAAAGVAVAAPDDNMAHKALQDACQRLANSIKALVGDAAEKAAMKNLRAAAKVAAGATTGLVSAAKLAAATCEDPQETERLRATAKVASEAVGTLTQSLQKAWANPDDTRAQDTLVKESHTCAPQAYKLVAASKSALPKINDPDNKNYLRQASDEAAEALQKLIAANKAVLVTGGQATIDQALERFSAQEASLDSVLLDIDHGQFLLDSNQTPDGATQLLNISAKQVATAIKQMASTAKSNPDELGAASTVVADSITQANTAAKVLASTVNEKAVQKGVILAARDLTVQARNALTSARSVAANPSDPNLNGLLANSAKSLAEALSALLAAAKGTQNSNKDCDDAIAAIANSVSSIEPHAADPKEYASYAEELENSIKAIQSACFALVSAAKSNPKGVGAAAKSTALSVPPLISAATLTAGASSTPDIQRGIIGATLTVANELTELIGAAKSVSSNDSPQGREQLQSASLSINAALDKLLAVVSNSAPGSKQFNEALEELQQATKRLAQSPPSGSDIGSNVESLKQATTKLGEATKGIITASRQQPESMGAYSREASAAVNTIVEAALALSGAVRVSAYNDDANRLRDRAENLVAACRSNDPAIRQTIIPSAREVTVATSALVESIKRDSQQAKSVNVQSLLNQAAAAIANVTSALINSAKAVVGNQPNAAEQLTAAQQGLEDAIENLLRNDPNQTTAPKVKRLVAVSRDAATSTASMVELGKNVLKKPGDADALSELSQSARSVGSAIKGLLDIAKSIGEIDLEDSINKVSQAIADLDSSSIAATVGLLENTAGNKTTQMLEEDLIEVARELANSIKTLIAEKDLPSTLGKACKTTANFIPRLAVISTQLAGMTSDSDNQQQTLSLAKDIADNTLGLLNSAKQNELPGVVNGARDASLAIGKMLSSRKGGVIALRDCDEACKTIAEDAKPLSAFDINSPIDYSKSYADSQRELTGLAKELVGAIATMVPAAKTKPNEVGEHAKRLASLIPQFVNHTTDAVSSVAEADARTSLLNSGKTVVSNVVQLVQRAKVVASDPKNAKSHQLLSSTYKDVSESISKLVMAIKAGATGEIKCEEAIESITRRIGDLDSASMFAATGNLQPENDDVDPDAVNADLQQHLKKIGSEVHRLVMVADKNQVELGNAASEIQDAFEKVTKETRTLTSLVNNPLTQQELLMSAKGVGVSAQLVTTAGLNLNKNPGSGEFRQALTEYTQKVAESLKELSAEAQKAAVTASSGVKDIEVARKAVLEALENVEVRPGNAKAGAADVLKAAKGIADAVVIIYGSTSADEVPKVIEAASKIKDFANDLLLNSKGAMRLTDRDNGNKLVSAAKATVQSTAGFLEAAKSYRKQQTPDSQKLISDANEDLVKMIGEVVEAAKPLPGSEEALKMFQETDELEALAEQELNNCASAIEDAARALQSAKQRQLEARKNKETPLPEEEISEAIIDAARAIATATGTLVNSASVAQKELHAKGKSLPKSQNVYRRDPAWAKGLISAAQEVAGSVKNLVTYANNAVAGRIDEENLVASAKAVAGATARLVFSSKTKADPFSPTQGRLSAAAKAVAVATKQLVEAAKSATKSAEETEAKPDYEAFTMNEKKKAELEAQAKILKLQQELDNAQRNLGNLRKAEYAQSANPQMAPGAAPTKAAPPRPSLPPRTTGSNKNLVRIKPGEKTFSYEELITKPEGIDHGALEQYLSDEDFVRLFSIDRASFAKAPEWKKTQAKQKLRLY